MNSSIKGSGSIFHHLDIELWSDPRIASNKGKVSPSTRRELQDGLVVSETDKNTKPLAQAVESEPGINGYKHCACSNSIIPLWATIGKLAGTSKEYRDEKTGNRKRV
jgi:hypothetical protein